MNTISPQLHGKRATAYGAVLPFYLYAAVAFLVAAILLFFSADAFSQHYFHPKLLAITHLMALGWGTMIILGASNQLLPVLSEGKLYSNKLAYVSFILAAIGVPLLVFGFYIFDMGPTAKWGGRLVVLAVLVYLVNVFMTIIRSKSETVHVIFVLTATFWLFLTCLYGLVILYNFTYTLLPEDSLHYLPLHAHAGIIGWFLLLIIGVASKLVPMFLISTYSNNTLLWLIYILINGALSAYVFMFLLEGNDLLVLMPSVLLTIGILAFIYFCFMTFRLRLRKKVDEQMKISLLSIMLIFIPLLLLFAIIASSAVSGAQNIKLTIAYGFLIFFGWITAIILGMTFKTLPFIVWSRIYQTGSGRERVPSPRDMFNNTMFRVMSLAYLAGLIVFTTGILINGGLMLRIGAFFILLTAILYCWNIILLMSHNKSLVRNGEQH